MTTATPSSSTDNEHYECDYMRQRAERIRKNEEYLAGLGLSKVKKNLLEMTKKTKRTLRREQQLQKKVKPGEERRSSRLSSKKTSSKHVMLSYYDDDDTNAVQVDDQSYNSEDDVEGDNNEDGTSNPITQPRYSRRRYTRVMENYEITDNERRVLSEVDDNFLYKFKEFLVFHNKISDQNVRNVMRQVGKLVRGEGIRYESPTYGWPEDCIFMKGVKVTPMSDIVQLMQDGQDCEDKWGRDHGNGWLLSHPLKKLLLFQQFVLNNPDFLSAKCKLADYYALDDDLDLNMGSSQEEEKKEEEVEDNTNVKPEQTTSNENIKKEEEEDTNTTPHKRHRGVKAKSPPAPKRKRNSTRIKKEKDIEKSTGPSGRPKRRKLL